MPDRYLVYIRQSHTPDATDSLSLYFQERALRDFVHRKDALVLETPIIDPGEKGWNPRRPGIEELIRCVHQQKPDAVAICAVSRFARDNWLQEGIWRRLKQLRPKLRFESATEPHAEDDLVRGILGVVSQAERKRMGKFLSSSFAERALLRDGGRHQMRRDNRVGHPRPIVDKARWERVRAMLESRRPIRTKQASSWLDGLLDCGCGAPMHWSTTAARIQPRSSGAQHPRRSKRFSGYAPSRSARIRPVPSCSAEPRPQPSTD